MMLTHTIPACQLRTANPDGYHRELGEAWEDILADNLTANGLPSYRPRQSFVRAHKLRTDRAWWKEALDNGWLDVLHCDLQYTGIQTFARVPYRPDFKPHPTYRVRAGNPAHDASLYRGYQRDVMVKVGKFKRLSVEVKALQPSAFLFHMVQVGCCPKWDEKKFKVDALILINQETSEAFVAPEPDTWQRQKGKVSSNELCYAVPRHLLTPLEAWIDFVKKATT